VEEGVAPLAKCNWTKVTKITAHRPNSTLSVSLALSISIGIVIFVLDAS
jgi:hypothetical protein